MLEIKWKNFQKKLKRITFKTEQTFTQWERFPKVFLISLQNAWSFLLWIEKKKTWINYDNWQQNLSEPKVGWAHYHTPKLRSILERIIT